MKFKSIFLIAKIHTLICFLIIISYCSVPVTADGNYTFKQIGNLVEGRVIDMGNGVWFYAEDPLNRLGVWSSQKGQMGYVYGGFYQVSGNSAGYMCPRLGKVIFTVKPTTIEYELNDVTLKRIKKEFGATPNKKGILKR